MITMIISMAMIINLKQKLVSIIEINMTMKCIVKPAMKIVISISMSIIIRIILSEIMNVINIFIITKK